MDTVSQILLFSSSFNLNVITSNRQSKPFTFYFNERVNMRPSDLNAPAKNLYKITVIRTITPITLAYKKSG